MRKAILTALAPALILGASAAQADPNCTCRAAGGVTAALGETVCIGTPSGPRMARCEMVLNNTSWKFLEAPCPQASRALEGMLASARQTDGAPLSLR
jgi:hypothetical protein